MSNTKKMPWFKFHVAAWRDEASLKMCSRVARSVWIDLLTYMHEAEPYGHLLIVGKEPTIAALAGLLALSIEDTKAIMEELETNNVFSRNSRGVIYSRRMIRDEKKRLEGVKTGPMGGNPTLWETSKKPRTLNATHNHTHNDTDNAPHNGRAHTRPRAQPRHREGGAPLKGDPHELLNTHSEHERDAPRPPPEGRSPASLTLPSGCKWNLTGPHPIFDQWWVRFSTWKSHRLWQEDLWGPPPGQPGSQIDLTAMEADWAIVQAHERLKEPA